MKNQNILRLFYFLSILLSVSLACKVFTPSVTQPPTDNPPVADTPSGDASPTSPTEPPVIELTVAPTEAPVQTSEQYFTEEFEGNLGNWTYFISKNDKDANTNGVEPVSDNGYLVLDLTKYLNVYVMYDPHTYTNVRLDARVDNRGTNNNNINLICRYSEEGWYEVAIANNGLYWLYAYDGVKGTYVRLANGGSNKIKAGKEVNEYTFICNERNLIIEINGFETKTYTDNQYVFRDGKVGIGASSFKDMPVKVEFDWVKISQP